MAFTATSSDSSPPRALPPRWSRELLELTSGQRWTLGVCGLATALFVAAGLPTARTVDDTGISGSLDPVGAAAVAPAPVTTPAPTPPPAPHVAPPVPAPAPQPIEPTPTDAGPSGEPPGEPADPNEPGPLSVLPIPLPLP